MPKSTTTNPSTVPGLAIGIDLGTTNCCVAVFRNGKPKVIDNENNEQTTPSYVAFTSDERLVGEVAKQRSGDDPENTIYEVKRLMGKRFNDENVQEDMKGWPFKVIEHNRSTKIEVTYKEEVKRFKPEEISAMLLEKMKNDAERVLDEKITKAVITVPAYFTDSQRQSTIDAGRIAGLDVLRILNEPTAAGYYYGMDKQNGNVLIFDLGGGTFDVTILNINEGQFTVRSTGGNSHLGGKDFDTILMKYCIEKFKEKHGTNIEIDLCAMQAIRTKCESAKISISTAIQTIVKFDYLFSSIKFSLTITRALFELLCNPLFRSTMDVVNNTLKESKLNKSEIDNIVLVGGSTRIPRIQQMLKEHFKESKIRYKIHPDLAVAKGAAILAAILNQTDNRQTIQNLKLRDVTPLSLGIEVGFDRIMKPVIKRNTPIPAEVSCDLVTSENGQTVCTFSIFEGERHFTKDNVFLGKFEIEDIPPGPRGQEQLTCTFRVDENGILSVSATHPRTGKQNEITITNNGQMSSNEIEQKIAEAEQFRNDEEKVRQSIMAKNNLENYVYKVNQNISSLYGLKQYETIQKRLNEANELICQEQHSDANLYTDLTIRLYEISNVAYKQ